ncbi:MAG: hypothetical protein ACKO2D_11430 [Chloroflexota bacterium]
MNGKMQRAMFGGVVATALVGGIGFSLATVLPASAQVMGPATRMAMPGGQFQRGLDGVGLQGRQAQGPDAMAFGRGRDAVARPDIDGVLATTLAITEEQVYQELAGKSVADVVAAHGGDLEAVKAAVLADSQAKLDAAVQAGTLTADQAATMATNFASHLDAMLTQADGRMGGGRGHGMAPGGTAGADPSQAPVAGDQSIRPARIGRDGVAGTTSADQAAPAAGDAQRRGPAMGDRGGRRGGGGPNGPRGMGPGTPAVVAPAADGAQS